MKKDTSFLYTGMSSSSYRKSVEKRQQLREEKAEKRGIITPVEELINAYVNAEIARVTNIASIVVDHQIPKENIKAQLLASQLHYKFLKDFQSKLTLSLRKSKLEEVKEDENG